ncbi:ABC transporter permease [Rhizobium sp. BK376]|jgi:ribose transport system permease protein|uniref:ABC transporter permease n=1 Tax=Rhizobium sp. BK376 TaxID=2512149 RepID=UPI001048FC80|nr:ABC transporter permease [Rhizobium sp. BK376]TCR72786.1 monosaccharide ABC transporter membrane protein (CUT2 family) [Rhizobium sp. BK376]
MSGSVHSGNRRPLASYIKGSVLICILYFLLYAAYVAQQPRALNAGAIANLVNNTVPLALAAAGQAFVVIVKGFDLSLAGVVSVTNVVMAVYPLEGPGGAFASLIICLAIGAVVGAINGWLVAYLRIQSIAATLATMIVCKGVALVILDAPGGSVAEWVSDELTDRLFNLPVSGMILALVVVVWLLVRRTDLGISMYAIGADETAAALSGVNVRWVRFMAFVSAGMLFGLAGYMLSAQTATGSPTAGDPLLMLSFAAVALGGTSLSGGKGGLFASIVGAATLTLLQKLLFSSGVSSFYTGIFQGAVLILAVVFSGLLSHFAIGRKA